MGFLAPKKPSPEYVETVNEIMEIYKSLPPRPTIEEVEAAISVINTSNTEQQLKLMEISKQVCPKDVPPDLFYVLIDVRKNMVLFQTQEQQKEANILVELDQVYHSFDELIQKASKLISGDTHDDKEVEFNYPVVEIKKSVIEKVEESKGDDVLVKSSSTKSAIFSSGGNTEKLSLMKVAALIETIAKNGTTVLDLEGKLMENIEWLPVSLGKLSNIYELNISNNRIMAIPSNIGNLMALTKLDAHSNQLINLPDSFGELVNLTDLDLHANRLKSLPPSFGNLKALINLDLSSNNFTHLPDIIGNLIFLKTLNVETNDLEEIPYNIGSCSSLVEFRLDFNQLRALPEALGKLECLEILTLHYNRIKRLPTTISSLTCLRELDVSFNELESIPESLCLIVSLEKLNVANNFADLRALPRSIGNLEKLEELDISDDQIRVLPDSFRFLSKLRVFRADETPLEVPPRKITILGAQAVVQYMEDLVSERIMRSQQPNKKKKGFWFRIYQLLCL